MPSKISVSLVGFLRLSIASSTFVQVAPTLAQISPLNQARKLHPDQVTQLEAQCVPPDLLSVQSVQNEGQPQRASFNCWQPETANGSRSGTWLGVLPLSTNDPTFVKPVRCSTGDQDCQTNLALMQARYPQELQQAEFACAIKSGSLFFVTLPQAIDVRCGFFAIDLYAETGDSTDYLEQPTSVDVSLMQLPRLGG